MKKISILFFLLILLLFSCSKKDASLFAIQDIDTLKYSATAEIEKINWTENIDGYILFKIEEEKETNNSKFSDFKTVEVKDNKNEFQRLFLEKHEIGLSPIYPSLSSFGNLNISAIDQEIITIINLFMESYTKDLIDKSVLNPSQEYLNVILEYDFENYPKAEAWLFGEPFISEESTIINDENQEVVLDYIYEVPLRVYSSESYFDLIFCIITDNEKYYIDQIILGSIVSE